MAENEKRKVRFNFIDVLIILVLIAAVGIFGYFAMGKWEANKAGASRMISYTVEIKEVTEDLATSFHVGDKVREVRKGTDIGKITAVEAPQPTQVVTENKNEGKFEMSVVPERYTVKLTIESAFSETEEGFSIDDVEVKVGKSIALKTDNSAANSIVMRVEKKGA